MKKLRFLNKVFSRRYIVLVSLTVFLFTAADILGSVLPAVYTKLLNQALNHECQTGLLITWIILGLLEVTAKDICKYYNSSLQLKMFDRLGEFFTRHMFSAHRKDIEEKGAGFFAGLYTHTGQRIIDLFSLDALQSVIHFISIIVMVVIIFSLNMYIAIAIIAFFGFSLLMSYLGNKKYMNWARGFNQLQLNLFSQLVDSLRGAITSRIYRKTASEIQRFDDQCNQVEKSNIKAKRTDFCFFHVAIEVVSIIFQLGVLVWCIYAATQGRMLITNAILIVYYCESISQPIVALSFAVAGLRDSWVSIGTFSESICCDTAVAPAGTSELDSIRSIAFHDVTYSTSDNVEILKNMNFSVASGEKVAILGESGKGKSTIINMLLGIINSSEYDGTVLINDKPVSTYTVSSLLDRIGVQMQSPAFYDVSLAENLSFLAHYNDEEIRQMLSELNLDSVELNDKVDVKSGGEKSRLALARVLLMADRRDVIILDEPLEGVDQATVEKAVAFLKKTIQDKTLIIVTHNDYIAKNLSDRTIFV